MNSKTHPLKFYLKNFFFNNKHKTCPIQNTISVDNEEEKNLHDYITSYQSVTRWI